MDEDVILWWAFTAWLMLLLLAGAATWAGLHVVLLGTSHPGLATGRTRLEHLSLVVGGAAALIAAILGLARELRRWPQLIALALVLGAGCWSPPERVVAVRPIRIRVVDSRTGEPLANVPVSYAIQTIIERERLFGVLPALEADVGPKLAVVTHGETDERGEVSFHVRPLRLPGNERLDDELAFVNLGVDLDHPAASIVLETRDSGRRRAPHLYGEAPDDAYVAWSLMLDSKRGEVYRNPAPSHRGALLISLPGARGAGHEDWTRPTDPFRVQWNFSSLQKPAEAVVVPLDPALDPPR